MIWKCIARKRTVPHTGNYYFLAGDDQQLNNSPSSFRFPRSLNIVSGLVTSVQVCEVCQYHIWAHICHKYHKLCLWSKNCNVEKKWQIWGQVTSVQVCEACQYHICASLWSMSISHLCNYASMWISHLCKFKKYVNIKSVQVCKYVKYVNFVWSHLCIKLTQGLLFPPLHWLISLYWDQEARAGYIWRIIVKMCKRKTKYINLLRVSSYWKLLKLIGWQSCCSMSCRVIVARYQWLNSDFSIQRIFPHCQDIGSNSNIFGSLLTACEFKKYWLLKLIGRQNVVSSERTISG